MTVLTEPLRKRFALWLDRRQPEIAVERLTQKNIYIVPSAQSLGYLLTVFLIWLGGTNYENNLMLGLAFFLIAVFISAMHATHANLSGLTISITGANRCFAGDRVTLQLCVENPSQNERARLVFLWEGAEPYYVDVDEKGTANIAIELPTMERGWFHPGRVKVQTRYPLGLFTAWSWPKLKVNALIYPRQVAAEPTGGQSTDGDQTPSTKAGIDDFGGLDAWQPGTAPQRIAWKQYSAGRGMLEKKFEALSYNPVLLDWEQYPDLGTEGRLSALAAKIVEMESKGQIYGLQIPGSRHEPSQGEAHMHKLLSSLATFNLASPMSSAL